MILQMGVKPSWFNTSSATMDAVNYHFPGTPSATDLRGYMLNSPRVGDSAVPEMLLKVLEPYRKEGESSFSKRPYGMCDNIAFAYFYSNF